jgi:hypothetical protein
MKISPPSSGPKISQGIIQNIATQFLVLTIDKSVNVRTPLWEQCTNVSWVKLTLELAPLLTGIIYCGSSQPET